MALKKIVLDTNVVESALRSRLGTSYQILSNLHMHRFRFGISVPLFLEYQHRVEQVFHSGIVRISEKAKNAILKALAFYADEVPIYYKIRPNLKDENDNMIFECAANYNADYIVTFNVRDFRQADLAPYKFEIITPQEFLQEVFYV